ncbi:hypothetical protein Q1695_000496 [Nippostrongylus brasiliensis]|nr:hypothetical protein Q1695_000496 [Nippostrongylus brasiliensis]
MTVCFRTEPVETTYEDNASSGSVDPSQANKSSIEGHATTDDELESRMSRRSSVLVDLISLFRRSSSAFLRHTKAHTSADDDDDDYDEDEEDTQTMSKDRILEAIKQKREIIGKLRSQPWNMKRKRRTLKVAQRHLQRQEAKVSRVRLFKAEAGRRFTSLIRWFDNVKIYLIPWEAKIKRIESHFGSVVSSYFTFLRWTLGVNVCMTVIMLMFVIIPEWLADSRMTPWSERYNRTRALKVMPDSVRQHADEMSTVWDLGGYMEYSLMFYGYYSRETFFGDTVRYRVPLAYFLSNLFVLGYSFFTILRKMAANARTSKLTAGKTEQYVFNWKTFTGWDFTIGNFETAGNVYMANVIKFREAIAEYAVNMKRKYQCLQILIRIFANMLVFVMLGFSVWAILAVSQIRETDTFIKQNAVSITVSFITLIFPNIFELIGKMERYHPRTALRIQLARILCLYIVNYYTLIVSLMMKLKDLESERRALENTQVMALQAVEAFTPPIFRQRLVRELTPSSIISPPTTPAVWTTVFSDFGPIGVSNPKAVVSKDTSVHNATVVVTHVIGPNIAWRRRDSDNYTTYRVSRLSDAHNSTEMCWETQIGQEITKLVVMDLLMTIAAVLVIDFFRGLLCRYCNLWWCWNLERTFPEYGEFKVAENVLHLVNNQGMIWLGLFFVPMLPMINNVKLILLMYIRSWAVMTCNIPARQIFRASRSSNFYLMLLLLMLFLCTLPVGYVIASRTPSKRCGPFGDQPHFYSIVTDVLHENLNASLVDAIKYITSPGIVIPVLLLLLLIIYFLFALVRGLREANHDLSSQLMQERTEEKKKIFELAGGKKKRRILAKKAKASLSKQMPNRYSAVEDARNKHRPSMPRSIAPGTRGFMPSLGSVSEVDHSDVEEAEMEPLPPPKLTIRQRLLCCMGLSDRNKYMKCEGNPVFAEEGEADEKRSHSTEKEDCEEDEVEQHQQQRISEISTVTKSTSSILNDGVIMPRSQSTHYTDPHESSKHGSSSTSHTSLSEKQQQQQEQQEQQEQQQQPQQQRQEVVSENDLTRPSSVESLSETAPPAIEHLNNSNPHSSYTSAMMSPIMSEVLSTDEGTDDEKSRLIPDRSSASSQMSSSKTYRRRSPRFRISMSPSWKRQDGVGYGASHSSSSLFNYMCSNKQ